MSDSYRAFLDRQSYENWLLDRTAIVVAICITVLAVVLVWRHRRRIARAADEAAITTLAAGVKAGRKIGDKAASYRQRIIDRADDA